VSDDGGGGPGASGAIWDWRHTTKLVVADIIVLLIEALKLSAPPTTSSYRLTPKPTITIPAAPTPPDQAPRQSAVSDFPIGCVKGVFDVTT
jgi:hypothetical protein